MGGHRFGDDPGFGGGGYRGADDRRRPAGCEAAGEDLLPQAAVAPAAMNGVREAAAGRGRLAPGGGRCPVAAYASADDGTRIFALRDPLRTGIVLAAVTELACATLVHTSADSDGTREIPVSHGIAAASLLASAGQPAWRVPVLASASLQHFV